MRPILFRGKDKETGEWIYGDLIHDCAVYLGQKREVYSVFVYGEGAIEIDPDTVGQYIDHKDNNGEDIFEGDILDRLPVSDVGPITKPLRGVVVWSNEDSSYFVKDKNGATALSIYGAKESEVIGNIYDNPKLLRGE